MPKPRRKIVEKTEPVVEKEKDENIELSSNDFSGTEKLSKSLVDFRGSIIASILEGGHLTFKTFDKAIDFAAESIESVTVSGTKLLSGFLLPANFGWVVNSAVEKTSKAGAFLAKGAAKISLNVFTFGAPAWVDAMRQGLAVHDANLELKRAKSGKEVLAVSYIDHLKDEKTQLGLREYYEQRKNLAVLRKNPTENEKAIKKAVEKIAEYEVSYKDQADFKNLKAILEKTNEFVEKNETLIDQLSEETADKMIANVENYYKENVGEIADDVEGKWLSMFASSEFKREHLVEKIKDRLKKTMMNKLDNETVKQEMSKVKKDLISSFAVYRKFLKASTYLLLRELPQISDAIASTESWSKFQEVAQDKISITAFLQWFFEDEINLAKTYWNVANINYDLIKNYVAGMADKVTEFGKSVYDKIPEFDPIQNTVDIFNAQIEHFSEPKIWLPELPEGFPENLIRK